MREWKKQSHVTWYDLYRIVFIPKYRKKSIFGRLRKEIGGIFHEICRQFEIGLIEGHAQPNHVHLCLSIPPKYGVAQAVGRLRGKSALMKKLSASISQIKRRMSNNWNNTFFPVK